MIDQLDRELASWVTSIIGDVPTRFDMPTEQPEGRGVVLFLLSFSPTPPASSGPPIPLQVTLRYLVTTWAESPPQAHKLLGDLVLAAMEEKEYELELEPLPAETWQAFHLPPQPAFVLRVLLRKPLPEPTAKYVTKVILEPRAAVSVYGLVRGPKDIPIANARIELGNSPRSTYTDAFGQFHFDNLPAGMPTNLSVKAKGRVLDVTIEKRTSAQDPFVISLPLE
jgi:hypothetical protein